MFKPRISEIPDTPEGRRYARRLKIARALAALLIVAVVAFALVMLVSYIVIGNSG